MSRRVVPCFALLLAALPATAPNLSGAPPHASQEAGDAEQASVGAGGMFPAVQDIRLRVRILTGERLPEVGRMCDEVERIWAPHDVQFDWRSGGRANDDEDPVHVVVMLVGAATTPASGNSPAGPPLASLVRTRSSYSLVPSSGLPDAVILVSMSRVRQLVLDAVADQKSGEMRLWMASAMLPIAIGRAVGHEIGHYLLETAEHSDQGLMRASFNARDVTAGLRSFTVDPVQLAQLRARWAARGEAPPLAAAR